MLLLLEITVQFLNPSERRGGGLKWCFRSGVTITKGPSVELRTSDTAFSIQGVFASSTSWHSASF